VIALFIESVTTLLIHWGLPALFGISFLAATVLPIASEWLLAAVVVQGADLLAAVGIATAGNTLGAITTWAVGMWGSSYLICKWLRISSKNRIRAEQWYARWGSWSLLMAWAPVVGDPLCLVGGLLKVPLGRFTLLVALGKATRYAVVAWTAQTLWA
jgi:membrane protein YqaA with SNARE-associated domain